MASAALELILYLKYVSCGIDGILDNTQLEHQILPFTLISTYIL